MNKTLKIGIVGCGGHMYEFLYNTLKWAPTVHVQAVCDINEERLNRFTTFYNIPNRYTDYQKMFQQESLDAVICVIHETLHYHVAKAAMLAGLDIFVEKTPSLTTAQTEELAAIQAETEKTTMVGFNRRFMRSYAMAKEISARTEFGGIYMYQSQFHSSPYRSNGFFKLNHIIHHLDLARFFLGEIKLTHAEFVSLRDEQVGYAIMFQSEQGAVGTIHAASLLHESYPMERLELLGNRRNIVVDNVKGLVYNRPSGSRTVPFCPPRLEDQGDALVWNPNHGTYPRTSHQGYEEEIHYFIDCLSHHRIPEPNIADSVKTMRLLDDLEVLLTKPEPITP